MFVELGYGLACDPEDPDDIVAALRKIAAHSEEMRAKWCNIVSVGAERLGV